jgi:FtsP/CotA-like multicopper oxidase with cupredoxin domain
MKLLRVLLALGLSLTLLVAGGAAALWFTVLAPVSTVGEVDFDQELSVPPLADSIVDADGTRVFELTAAEGTTELKPGLSTQTWGFNGSYLGPTLRAEKGERVRVEVTNDLPETTSVHWHGMELPAAADGGPHQPIATGATWSPTWTVDQPAATLWYHPHPHGATEKHVARGLAGMFLLDDPGSPVAQALPDEYGVDDVPVIVQDTRLARDGTLQTGGLGEHVVVNGVAGPYLDVTTERVRLRLLNASVQRVFEFGFSDDRRFDVVAGDSGLLPRAVRTDRVRLSPGERAEIVVTMAAGEDVVLRSHAPDLEANALVERFNGGEDEFDLMQLRAADRLRSSPEVPATLAPESDLDLDGARSRTFELSGRSINGASMDMGRIDEVVETGATEIWEVHNRDGEPHNFHVHGTRFRVLSVDGGAPGPLLSGWKDTVYVPPGGSVQLAMRFGEHADPGTPYMFHCHLLSHEDGGMMGQFVVVEPGQQPTSPDHDH